MEQYIDLGKDILTNGNVRDDRTKTGTISVFGRQVRFNLTNGKFPLVTTKKMWLKGIIHELLWFLQGDTNNNTLNSNGVNIWNEWATEDGELGPIYSAMWRSWPGEIIHVNTTVEIENGIVKTEPVRKKYDQIADLIEGLKKKPFSRRHIVSAWNPEFLPDESISPQENVLQDKQALPPCHALFQFYVREIPIHLRGSFVNVDTTFFDDTNLSSAAMHRKLDAINAPKYYLDCQLYMRSCDTVLGLPYNIASYALLTMMIAQCTNMVPGEFITTFGDVHIYKNHIEKFEEQLTREPYPLPTMKINPNVKDIFSFKFEDFDLVDYKSHSKIEYEISV